NDNPTRHQFETTLATLEGGAACAAFPSGMAAATTLLQGLQTGDHVVVADDVFYGVRYVLRTVFEGWGLTWTEVDLSDVDALEAALRPETRLVWAETPSNPLMKITDLAAVAERTHAAGARLVVDS